MVLDDGWNLMSSSLPLISSMKACNINEIYSYDAQEKRFKLLNINSNLSFSYGEAYWIHKTYANTIRTSSNSFTLNKTNTFIIKLFTGWNLIGFPDGYSNIKFNMFSNITEVFSYDNKEDKYNKEDLDSCFQETIGYLVKCDSTLSTLISKIDNKLRIFPKWNLIGSIGNQKLPSQENFETILSFNNEKNEYCYLNASDCLSDPKSAYWLFFNDETRTFHLNENRSEEEELEPFEIKLSKGSNIIGLPIY